MPTDVQLTLDTYFAEAVRLAAKELEPAPGRCQLCEAPVDASDTLCEECLADEEMQDRWRKQSDRRRARESIAGYYEASRRAVALARVYRAEPETTGRRERECLDAIDRYRNEIRKLRLELRGIPERVAGPGLQKTRRSIAGDLGAIIEEIGDDVRLRRTRTMFGATSWEASAPMGSERRHTANGTSPAEALVALRDAIADDEARAGDEDDVRIASGH